MHLSRVKLVAAFAALALATMAAAIVDRCAPPPAADVHQGTEEPFVVGLHPRELAPGHRPLRWTRARSTVRFANLPPGAGQIALRARGHRGTVRVSVSGVLLGTLEPGRVAMRLDTPSPRGGVLELVIDSEAFRAGDGRELGTQLERVSLVHGIRSFPSPRLLLAFWVPALATVVAALLAGLAVWAATGTALLVTLLQCLALWPSGLLRSGYLDSLAMALTLGAVVALTFAALARRRWPGAAAGAFVAMLVAVIVQGLAATSPIMVVSDAVFHANKLAAVAGGDLFPISVTQHAEAFRFPYGVSFYALLSPLAWAGLDRVALVRGFAALSGVGAAAAIFLLLARHGAARAATAVVFLQLLPTSFDVHSYGNLSNVFGQSLTTAFFAWWASSTPGGMAVGAALVCLAALGHFSSLVVSVALACALAVARGRGLLRDRVRWGALVVGLGLAALYYSGFLGLIMEQLPRLMEGGAQGSGGVPGALGALRRQLFGALGQWGLPCVLLAVLGRPRYPWRGLDRDLVAYWAAGATLAVAAVVSPLEVRYIHALAVPLAVAASAGFHQLLATPGWARRAVAWLLLALQAGLGLSNIAEAVVSRYRP